MVYPVSFFCISRVRQIVYFTSQGPQTLKYESDQTCKYSIVCKITRMSGVMSVLFVTELVHHDVAYRKHYISSLNEKIIVESRYVRSKCLFT